MAPARLIGRDDDVAILRDAIVSARAEEPRCLLVTGEAGIGKSRLVREALTGMDDTLVVTGHGADMSTGEIPFGVLADTLRDLLHRRGADALTAAERTALAPLLPGSVPSGHVERVQVLSAFVDLLQRLCAEQLVVWVVEDLHWADSATRDLVNLAVRTLRGRLLVVATVRTDDPERTAADEVALTSYVAGLARLPRTTVVPLTRLTPEEVRAQLLELVGSGLSPAVATRIEQLSDGVPFVVEELAAARGRPEVATASNVAAGRLARLFPEARRLVEAAAVGEGHLRIGLLEQVVDATSDELDVALAEAVRSGILVTDNTADAVAFRHALLREAADRELGPGARRSWHRRWAEVLEASPGLLASDPAALAIAEHWHHARDVRRSVEAALAAQPAAERIASVTQQAQLFCRVLEGWSRIDDPESLTGWTLRRVVADAVAVAGPGALADGYALLDAVPLHLLAEHERAAVQLFRALWGEAKGEFDRRFRDQAAHVFDLYDWFSGPRDLFTVHVLLCATRLRRDDPRAQQALELGTVITGELATTDGGLRARARVIEAKSHSRQFESPAAAADFLEHELACLPDRSDNYVLLLDGNLVWCRAVCGEHRSAQQVGAQALARLKHPQLSLGVWEHLVENHTFSLTCTGDWTGARALLEESAPWWEDDLRSSNVRLDLLDIRQRGAVDAEKWRAHIGGDIPGGAAQVLVRHVVAAAGEGDPAGARETYRGVWTDRELRRLDDYVWLMVVDAARMEADAAVGAGVLDDWDDARAHLDTIDVVAGDFHRHGALGEVWPLDLAAQLDRFHGRDARANLEAALAGWERIGHVPDAAVTHLSLAEAHALHGDRESARRHLSTGREIATRLDALPMLKRADALAERWALASRERRTSDVLTGREAEVLALLAEGRTNAEIADTLFMSPKTASVHVSHIIAKLGAANRTEAAATARRHGLLP
ncbi:helix-turn-helix transcriptional regulator [Nocardioides astragali]|uniref:AAA family ATPase n=1 Tax=Nocardioides astragali TaxID=1776736 RepID=A0ABW2N5T3_9ACTN|nr:helix-turn-helix transcriptional regulator [Nocardioides astragali]